MISVRMRASLKGEHVSGAERIVEKSSLDKTVIELLNRPKDYDFININVELLKDVFFIDKALKIESFEFKTVKEAKTKLIQILESYVKKDILSKALTLLENRTKNIRGAHLLDIELGELLEQDRDRGVRTVKIDWEDREGIKSILLKNGFTERTVDALAIATKNIECGVLAEICWSDDPNYVSGYVTVSNTKTYYRLTPLKEKGDPFGGRVYFISRKNLDKVVSCLENKAFLIRSLSEG